MNNEIEENLKRVLVVGFGSIGKRHVRIVKSLYPKIKIVVLRHSYCEDSDIEKFGLFDCVISIESALEFKPDVAIIANPATKHLKVAQVLASSGIHLLVEKPISASTNGVQSLINTCEKKSLVLMTAYNLRFQKSLIAFSNYIRQQKIGDVLLVKAEVGQALPSWRPDSDYRKTVSAQKSLGGGVLLELSHEIDYLSWIFGDIVWVKAHISRQSDLEIDVEDTANIILGVNSNNKRDVVVSLNMDFIRCDSTRQCMAIGDKGSLRWDANIGEVAWFPKNGKEWSTLFLQTTDRDYTYTEEIKYFFSKVTNGKSDSISGIDGLKTVQVIESIHQSHNSGSMVAVDF